MLAFYGFLVVGLVAPSLRPPRRWCWVLLAAWFALGTWRTLGPPARVTEESSQLVCTFIAVGHGTSVLLEWPGGRSMLYDAGRLGSRMSGGRSIAGVLWSRGLTHLDALVISHADADHFNAIPYLLDRFSVGVVYVAPGMFLGADSQPAVLALRQALDQRGAVVRTLAEGDRLLAHQDCLCEVLHPPPQGIPGSDNANSLVIAIEYAGRRLLLPGDL
jgi:competence protein ComEC